MGKGEVYRKTFSMALITLVIFAVTLLNSSLQQGLVQWLLIMVAVLSAASALMAGSWAGRSLQAWTWAKISVLYLGLFIGMLVAAYFALVYVWLHHGIG